MFTCYPRFCKFWLRLLIYLLFFGCSGIVHAATSKPFSFTSPPPLSACTSLTSVKSGLWTDPAVWSCNRIPTPDDYVHIAESHTITIPASTTVYASRIKQAGVLRFARPDAFLKLSVSLSDGLVAYYPFNGNASDESGNNRHGTVHDATLTTDRFGNPDKAYNFDGVNDRIKASSEFSTQMSISLWFKGPFPSNANGRWPVLASFGKEMFTIQSFGSTEPVYNGWYGKIAISSYQSASMQNTSFRTEKVYMDSTWHHLTAVYDAPQGFQKLYIDGSFIGQAPVTSPYNSFSHVDFGVSDSPWGNYTHAGYYWGQLDDIRIYNRPLSEPEIQRLYTLEAPPDLAKGLIAYYPFNGNANDESGNNRHGTVHDATLTTDRFGNPDKAYNFDGNDWISAKKDTAFQFNDFTLSAWMTIVDNPGMIVSYPANGGTENAWQYGYGNIDGQLIGAYVYPNTYLFGRRAFSPGTWYHVVFTKKGTMAKVIVNGETLITSTVPATIIYTNPRGLLIGADDDTLEDGIADIWFFKGKLDDIRIYNRPLSDREIQTLATDK